MIGSYMDDGDMFKILVDQKLKNIALRPESQGKLQYWQHRLLSKSRISYVRCPEGLFFRLSGPFD